MTESTLHSLRTSALVEARMIAESPNGLILPRVADAGIGAAIWRRSLSPGFARWVDEIPLEQLPALRSVVELRSVESAVHTACDISGLPRGEMRDLFASDIAALALVFAQVAASPVLHLRLEAVTTDACRRYHIDRMPSRLVCSYRGPGTQFAREDAEGNIIPVTRMKSGEVAIMRGTLWPGEEVTRLLHRSPPIKGTGQARLFLALDPAIDPDDRRRLH
ncbi:DUF1826 domain-containing protein [Paracoccus kondratievae]|uniref:DUF1826 domain-containing protein n=1 Tax=Paracoccus kondratievae TaxID=135740 RepID=A0AAD3NZY6_9RHOB|nr:DUF1826 domain-containing protein [Paracoccus kondratievae]GLK65062.1 hypothetical protein GCM10017635_25330 [Paracoccus kondratievae]